MNISKLAGYFFISSFLFLQVVAQADERETMPENKADATSGAVSAAASDATSDATSGATSGVREKGFRARLVKVEGDVYIVNARGERRQPQQKHFLVNADETVVTDKNSKAVIQFDDGAMSVLAEKSSLRIEKSGWLSQLGGKIYYVFRKVVGKKKSKNVKTSFATIGIRGTTFIVDVTEGNQQVALQEGKLNIESPGDDYEFHKPAPPVDDFAAFKRQKLERQQAMNNEFSDYKKNLSKEFVEYKKSFDLEANNVVSFNGKRVNQAALDTQLQLDFGGFSEFSKDYIDAYKELDESTDDLHNAFEESF